MSAGAHAFDVDTAVQPVADRPGEAGRFAAVITDRWNVLGRRPNRGYVLGVALRALAAFSDLAAATGGTVILAEPPALPPPDEAVDLLSRGAIPGPTFTQRVEYRVALPGWAMGRPSGRASMEFWMRYRDGRDAPGWLACRSTTRFVSGGFHEEDLEIWGSAGVLVAQSGQLALLPG